MASGFVVDEVLPVRRSLRVAVVTETFPPEVNGVAATIARVVEGLQARGHALQLIRPRQDAQDTAKADERLAEVLMRGLPIPRYPQLKMGLPSRRALIGLWTRRRPDVVHIVTEGPLGWSALQAALHLKLPVVSDFRTNFHAYSAHYGLKWLKSPVMAYLRKFHNRTACTMVPTEGLKQDLASQGFRNLAVVARGVDTRLYDPARRSAALRASWGVAEDTPVVVHVGRLAPEKNLDLLLMAFARMQALEPRCRLVLVGDGPAAASVRQRCPQAVMAGVQRGEALAAHYASGDIFLFPSLTETFGNVVPEAMASGLALLAFDYAAPQQLVRHGANGLLARFADEQAFIGLAEHLASHLGELPLLGRAARETALRLDWGRIIGQVEDSYLQALRADPTQALLADRRPLAGAL